ncbi:YraN family protein [Tenacibaculum insulae]|uniref:YraN family protein n=1 Tax=Tenacibaculum insulae TaxID=2029677 RepID=UPI003AB6866E
MAQHNELGKEGEKLAVEYLQKNGYLIVEKNYRFLKAEVDIIAKKEKVLIAIEVKTRTSTYFGNPQDFVNPKKIKLLVSAIDNYIVKNDIDLEVRFDIIAILKNKKTVEIKHLKDAFLYF